MNKDELLGERISEYTAGDAVPFHMPGHKRNPSYAHLMGLERIDVTEIEGLDDLHNAKGVILDAQNRAARLFSVPHCRFLINGSTSGILAAIRAVTRQGDRVLVARNCHRSVYNAAELYGLDVSYVLPERIGDFYGSVTAEAVDSCLASRENVKLVVITSPTYEGVLSDIATISEVCHRHGALLLVDEAHGAHLGLYGVFNESARQLRADIVVNSLHKTLPALTQTAVLHVISDSVDIRKVDEALAMLESSSPSYVLMSSMDGLIGYLREHGREELYRWKSDVLALREEIRVLLSDGQSGIGLFDEQSTRRCFLLDESRLCLTCDNGFELAAALRKCSIEPEMAGANHVIALTGMGDTRESFDRLYEALKRLNTQYRCAKLQYTMPFSLPKKAMGSFEASAADSTPLPFNQCAGKISAENVWVYPPGAPIIVKGELIDGDTLDALKTLYDSGAEVQSSGRTFPSGLLCVRNE